MDFALDPEQRSLQRVTRDFFAARSPESAVRAQLEDPTGHDRDLWSRMNVELGLCALAVPEAYGGFGYGFVELGIVLEELGRALVVSPFFASGVMATSLLLRGDDEQAKADLLPGLAAGEVVGTVAMAETTGSWSPSAVTSRAERHGIGWTVTGTKHHVLDGAVAGLLLVVARHDDELVVLAVEGSAECVQRTPVRTLDLTRKEAVVELRAAPGRRVGGAAAVKSMLDLAAVALAAEALGGTDAVLRAAVEFVKVREQFGRPVGSFQAVKHTCADLLVELEASRSAAGYAAWAASVDSPELPQLASLVKAFCSDTYLAAAGTSLHLHGGIGFTWEHAAHLHLKRAKNLQLFLGDPTHHRLQLADRLGV